MTIKELKCLISFFETTEKMNLKIFWFLFME